MIKDQYFGRRCPMPSFSTAPCHPIAWSKWSKRTREMLCHKVTLEPQTVTQGNASQSIWLGTRKLVEISRLRAGKPVAFQTCDLTRGNLLRDVVKLASRVEQRLQGLSQADVQNDQDRKRLIPNLVRYVLNHPDKQKLTEELQNNSNEENKPSRVKAQKKSLKAKGRSRRSNFCVPSQKVHCGPLL